MRRSTTTMPLMVTCGTGAPWSSSLASRDWAGRPLTCGVTRTAASCSSLWCVEVTGGGGLGNLSQPPLRRCGMAVFVVPVPPLVRRGLGIALGEVLPLLLTPERGHVEVAPGAPQRLVATVVDEVGTEHLVAI